MAEHFTYTFDEALPRYGYEREWVGDSGSPMLDELVIEAQGVVAEIEQFQELPERNQKQILDMTRFAMRSANNIGDKWRENFWGLYIVGSRASSEAQPDSDLDLLSVGTFYRAQGFSDWYEESDVFEGFELEAPKELPSEYNVGDVDRKYLVRATPSAEGVLPVDLNVVDLTFWHSTLESFKETMDVAEDGSRLARIPLFELKVPAERIALRL